MEVGTENMCIWLEKIPNKVFELFLHVDKLEYNLSVIFYFACLILQKEKKKNYFPPISPLLSFIFIMRKYNIGEKAMAG